jgi:choline dehydrogenase-like flavoprotein
MDRIIPADDLPGGWDGGVGEYLQGQWSSDLSWSQAPLVGLCTFLDGQCAGGAPYSDRSANEQDQLLARTDARAGIGAAVRVAFEGYYGGSAARPPAGWTLTGFDPGPTPPTADAWTSLTTTAPGTLKLHYDAIIIGSGPGGSAAAAVLARRGASVLVVERAPLLSTAELRSDHLHGKRMAVYAPTAGPGAGNPRATISTRGDGDEFVCDAIAGGDTWGLNAMAVGGGTRLWQGMAWRMYPEDFRMASTYGAQEGADLIDWPVDYDEMEPFYSDAEWELGVAGDDRALTARTPRSRRYPMPPFPDDAVRRLLGGAARTIGIQTGPIPFAINSVPHDGRPACAECGQCIGHACPVDAKNGAQNTFLARALRTGNCDLLVAAQVTQIEHRSGTAIGVRLVAGEPGTERALTADRVVVAAGAVETPRLLMASGLGNDCLGRFLHGHEASWVMGIAPQPVGRSRSPGHSIATLDYVHDGRAPIGGGVLFDMFSPYPLQLAWFAGMVGGGFFGAEHKAWMRDVSDRLVGIMGMAQELSTHAGAVRLHPALRDRRGVPAPIVTRVDVKATEANRGYLTEASLRWLEAAGTRDVIDFRAKVGNRGGSAIPAGEHSAGTARMADDPARGATDRYGRLHGSTNVFVSDSCLLPSSGGVNPTLTIVANALRVARSWIEDS